MGGAVATPGEHFMVQGKTLKQIFNKNFFSELYSVRGMGPTVLRELSFSALAVSGLPDRASRLFANYFCDGKPNYPTSILGTIVCAPLLTVTQPTARIAANMQLENQGFFATVRKLNAVGRNEVASLPKNASSLKRGTTLLAPYFPGGGLRVATLFCTGILYGLMDTIYSRQDTLSQTPTTNRPGI